MGREGQAKLYLPTKIAGHSQLARESRRDGPPLCQAILSITDISVHPYQLLPKHIKYKLSVTVTVALLRQHHQERDHSKPASSSIHPITLHRKSTRDVVHRSMDEKNRIFNAIGEHKCRHTQVDL